MSQTFGYILNSNVSCTVPERIVVWEHACGGFLLSINNMVTKKLKIGHKYCIHTYSCTNKNSTNKFHAMVTKNQKKFGHKYGRVRHLYPKIDESF